MPVSATSRARCVLVVSACLALMACQRRLTEDAALSQLRDEPALPVSQADVRVLSVSDADPPIVKAQLGESTFNVRFQSGSWGWKVDQVQQPSGEWVPPAVAFAAVKERMAEAERQKRVDAVVSAYARTFDVIEGWAEVLAYGCAVGLPKSKLEALGLHSQVHQKMFPKRGTSFHVTDLFSRDGWWSELDVSVRRSVFEVRSRGLDHSPNTPDDLVLEFIAKGVSGYTVYEPHFYVPAAILDLLRRTPDPPEWSRSKVLDSLDGARQLTPVPYTLPPKLPD
jgi:hypothetical protein